MVRIVKDRFGRVDILVNNASINVLKELEKMDTPEIEQIIAVNLRGTILCTRYVRSVMKAQNYGKIINIASVASFISCLPVFSVYCATKGAIVSLTRELVTELGKHKINVNAVAPGPVATAMTGWFADGKIK